MDKLIRLIFKSAFRSIWLVSCLMIFLSLSALAQTKSPIALKSDSWSLTYSVSAIGDFTVEPELGKEGPVINYHINRTYTGELMPRYQSYGTDSSETARDYLTFKDPRTSLKIKIDDFVHTIYDPICNEYDSIEEKWKANFYNNADSNDHSSQPGMLLFDNVKFTYSLAFPIKYSGAENRDDAKITYTKKVIHHSPNGSKVTDSPPKLLSLSSHNYPTVKGFIENGSVSRSAVKWSEFEWDEKNEMWMWNSPVLYPDVPLIDGVPESKQVGIIIVFLLKKIKK